MVWRKNPKWIFIKRLFTSPKNIVLRNFALPLKIQTFNFEITRRCSGNCLYCSIWQEKSFDELTINEVREGLAPRSLFRNVEMIGITGGEPFLRRDLVDLSHVIKEICPNASLSLVTNGLHPDIVLKMMMEIREFDPNVAIGVSIDGFEFSDGILRGNSKHSELAWKTIDLLNEEGFNLRIGSVITRLNIDEMLDFQHFCRDIKKIPHCVMTANLSEFFYANVSQKEIVKDLAIPKSKLSLFKKICLSGHVTPFRYYFPKYLEEKRQIFPCFSGFNSFFLSSNGSVYPCISLNKPLGNIREKVFSEFWNSKKARKIRESIVRQECHCYTECEVGAWLRANIFPAVMSTVKM